MNKIKEKLPCLKYTKDDWIRVLHDNILWADEELEKERAKRNPNGTYINFKDVIGLTYALAVYHRQLKDIDSEHPYQLSERIKSLQSEVLNLVGYTNWLHSLIIAPKKEEYTIKDGEEGGG